MLYEMRRKWLEHNLALPLSSLFKTTHHDAVHELLLLADGWREAAAAAGSILHRVATVAVYDVVVVRGHVVVVHIVDASGGDAGEEGGGGNLLAPDGDGDGAEIVI